jgi:hypothetical protein
MRTPRRAQRIVRFALTGGVVATLSCLLLRGWVLASGGLPAEGGRRL